MIVAVLKIVALVIAVTILTLFYPIVRGSWSFVAHVFMVSIVGLAWFRPVRRTRALVIFLIVWMLVIGALYVAYLFRWCPPYRNMMPRVYMQGPGGTLTYPQGSTDYPIPAALCPFSQVVY